MRLQVEVVRVIAGQIGNGHRILYSMSRVFILLFMTVKVSMPEKSWRPPTDYQPDETEEINARRLTFQSQKNKMFRLR